MDADFRGFIERQLSRRLPDETEDATLKHAGSWRVVRWAFRKAHLADGTRPWRPVSHARVVEQAVRSAMRKVGPLLGHFRRRSKDAWTVMRAALLRSLSGCSHREIGLRIRRHASTISRDVRDHLLLLKQSRDYEALHAQLVAAILDAPS
ncbi:MAG: hypothetical protein ACYTGZ_19845 [Planctomycetota bacterium]